MERLTIGPKSPKFYVDPESIYSMLEGDDPPVRLLDSQFVLQRADEIRAAIAAGATDKQLAALALPRRQDLERMHPEAYLSAQTVRALPGKQDENFGQGLLAIDVGSISHAWVADYHPDPYGAQLCKIADMIRKAQQGKIASQSGNLLVCPDGEKTMAYQNLSARFALFYDWTSIFQHKKR